MTTCWKTERNMNYSKHSNFQYCHVLDLVEARMISTWTGAWRRAGPASILHCGDKAPTRPETVLTETGCPSARATPTPPTTTPRPCSRWRAPPWRSRGTPPRSPPAPPPPPPWGGPCRRGPARWPVRCQTPATSGGWLRPLPALVMDLELDNINNNKGEEEGRGLRTTTFHVTWAARWVTDWLSTHSFKLEAAARIQFRFDLTKLFNYSDRYNSFFRLHCMYKWHGQWNYVMLKQSTIH